MNIGSLPEKLTRFLKDRIEILNKAIIFISNKETHEIAREGFSKSLEDLIERNTIETRLKFVDNYAMINQYSGESIWGDDPPKTKTRPRSGG